MTAERGGGRGGRESGRVRIVATNDSRSLSFHHLDQYYPIIHPKLKILLAREKKGVGGWGGASVLSRRRVERGPAAILNADDVWLMVTLLSARGHADLTKAVGPDSQ